MDKKNLSERDICSKFITPTLVDNAGWDIHNQMREEVPLTAGRIIVRGRMVKRGTSKRADYILYYKPNIAIAVIEAKANNFNLDIKNPHQEKEDNADPDELLQQYKEIMADVAKTRDALKKELMGCLSRDE